MCRQVANPPWTWGRPLGKRDWAERGGSCDGASSERGSPGGRVDGPERAAHRHQASARDGQHAGQHKSRALSGARYSFSSELATSGLPPAASVVSDPRCFDVPTACPCSGFFSTGALSADTAVGVEGAVTPAGPCAARRGPSGVRVPRLSDRTSGREARQLADPRQCAHGGRLERPHGGCEHRRRAGPAGLWCCMPLSHGGVRTRFSGLRGFG